LCGEGERKKERRRSIHPKKKKRGGGEWGGKGKGGTRAIPYWCREGGEGEKKKSLGWAIVRQTNARGGEGEEGKRAELVALDKKREGGAPFLTEVKKEGKRKKEGFFRLWSKGKKKGWRTGS